MTPRERSDAMEATIVAVYERWWQLGEDHPIGRVLDRLIQISFDYDAATSGVVSFEIGDGLPMPMLF